MKHQRRTTLPADGMTANRIPPYAVPYATSAQPRTSDTSDWRLQPIHPAKLPLMRPKQGRWLAGVCKGIAMHLGIGVGVVRLLFVISTVMCGAGTAAYIMLWMLVPTGDPVAQAARQARFNDVNAPLSRGNMQSGDTAGAFNDADAEETTSSGESLSEMFRHASKPALIAAAGIILLALALLLTASGVNRTLILPAAFTLSGIGISWLRYNAKDGQLWTMISGIVLIFLAYILVAVDGSQQQYGTSAPHMIIAGLLLLISVVLTVVPWAVSLIRDIGTERALKEREEERADMTAHLHDGVLQTLALIQLHAGEAQTVFTLARSQERELREWLYQERSTSDRSIKAGLKLITAQVEDDHGKPIEVVTVGDAQPSAQTDALLDATRQALVNAVTHGAEPISVYCEVHDGTVEIFVRDHGNGFDIHAIPQSRLGIKESIIGRIQRRGGTVEIVSRKGWGTEVRMHMPIGGGSVSSSASGEEIR